MINGHSFSSASPQCTCSRKAVCSKQYLLLSSQLSNSSGIHTARNLIRAQMTDYGVLAYPAFEGQYNQHPLTPLDTPSHSPQPPFHNNQQQQLYLAPQAGTNGTNPQLNNAANAGMAQFDQLIIAVSKKFPTLFPASTSTPVTSTHIDAIAYKVWGVCLNAGQGELLSRANQYGAMLSEIKLRAAARLNYLPSWCFLRERVVLWLQTTGKVVDDSAGMMQWKEATDEATKIIARAMRARFQTHAQAQASGLPIQMSGSPVQTSGIPMQDEAEERSGHF